MTPQNTHYDIAYRIDSICLQFADQLRQSTTGADRPSIESLLQQHSDLPRQQLLECLLSEELEYLTVQGQKPDANRLRQRFPQDHAIIDKALSRNPVKQAVPDECATQLAPADAASEGSQPKKKHPRVSTPAPHISGFDMLEGLGEGGMGAVFQAYDRRYKRTVAIKIIHRKHQANPQIKLRFENEIFALKRLSHANIVRVHESGEKDEVLYYSMDYVDGLNLELLIRAAQQAVNQRRNTATAMTPHQAADSTLPPDPASAPLIRKGSSSGNHKSAEGAIEYPSEDFIRFCTQRSRTENHKATKDIVQIGIDVANAMQHAHDAGVIHRDLKPNNLLLDKNGRIWVADFGLAQAQDATPLTMTGHVHGTLKYMSPEQLLGGQVSIDRCTDMYSLGATLYELLCLEPVREGNNSQEIRNKVAFGEPVSLRRRNPAIPRDLETIIHKAISHRPRDRYQTMQELSDDLRRFQRHEPILAKPAGPLKRLSLWVEREQKLAASLAASAALLIVILGLLLILVNGQLKTTISAQQQEQELRYAAERREKTAQAHRLALASLEQNRTDPGLAYLLAREAQKLSPDAIPEATTAAIEALRRSHEIRVWHPLPKPTPVITSAVRPNGIEFASVTADPAGDGQLLHLSDPMTGKMLQTTKLTGEARDLAWNPDGTTVLVLTEKHNPSTEKTDIALQAYTFNSAIRQLAVGQRFLLRRPEAPNDSPHASTPRITWSRTGDRVFITEGPLLHALSPTLTQIAPARQLNSHITSIAEGPNGQIATQTETHFSIYKSATDWQTIASQELRGRKMRRNMPGIAFTDETHILRCSPTGLQLVEILQSEIKIKKQISEPFFCSLPATQRIAAYGHTFNIVQYTHGFEKPEFSSYLKSSIHLLATGSHNGNLWISTYDSGLFTLSPTGVTPIPLSANTETDVIADIAVASNDLAIIVHASGKLRTLRSEPFSKSYELSTINPQTQDSRPVFRFDSAAIVTVEDETNETEIVPLESKSFEAFHIPGLTSASSQNANSIITIQGSNIAFYKLTDSPPANPIRVAKFPERVQTAQSLSASNYIFITFENGDLGLLAPSDDRLLKLTESWQSVASYGVSANGMYIAVSTSDGEGKLIKCTQDGIDTTVFVTNQPFSSFEFTHNNDVFYAAAPDGEVVVFANKNGKIERTPLTKTDLTDPDLMISPDQTLLLVGDLRRGGKFQIINLLDNEKLMEHQTTGSQQSHPAWSDDSSTLFIASDTGLVRYDIQQRTEVKVHTIPTYGLATYKSCLICLEQDGEQTSQDDNNRERWRLQKRVVVSRPQENPESFELLHRASGYTGVLIPFSVNFPAVLLQKHTPQCTLYSPTKEFTPQRMSQFDARLSIVRFVKGTANLLTVTANGSAQIFDTSNNSFERTFGPLQLISNPVRLTDAAADGSAILLVDAQRDLFVWTPLTAGTPQRVKTLNSLPSRLCVHPKGTHWAEIYQEYAIVSQLGSVEKSFRVDVAAASVRWEETGSFVTFVTKQKEIVNADLKSGVIAKPDLGGVVKDVAIHEPSGQLFVLVEGATGEITSSSTNETAISLVTVAQGSNSITKAWKLPGAIRIQVGANASEVRCISAEAITQYSIQNADLLTQFRFPLFRNTAKAGGRYGSGSPVASPDERYLLFTADSLECWPIAVIAGELAAPSRSFSVEETTRFGITSGDAMNR